MAIPFTMRVSIPDQTLMNPVGSEAVLINMSSEQYFELDDIGTQMWNAITSCESIQMAYERLLSIYDVEAEVLRHDLHQLVEMLLEQGLIDCIE